jgi:hypothetical protein
MQWARTAQDFGREAEAPILGNTLHHILSQNTSGEFSLVKRITSHAHDFIYLIIIKPKSSRGVVELVLDQSEQVRRLHA